MSTGKSFFCWPLLVASALTAWPGQAQNFDHVWLGGSDEFPGSPGYGHFGVFFSNDTTLVQTLQPLAFDFDAASASVSDETGTLLFYSNGCQVANAMGNILSDGESLSPGILSTEICPEAGYFGPQSLLALPWPGHPGEFCLLQVSVALAASRQWRYDQLYFSRIDMNADNGQGSVMEKNTALFSGDVEPPAAVRHGNGRDWWIILPEYRQNRFQRFLLTPDGPIVYPPVVAGQAPACEKSGVSVFSQTGNLLARWTECAVTVFLFDRCSGILSESVDLPMPHRWLPGGGVAFSPTGRYLYATSYSTLYRADLDAFSPSLDTMFYAYDPWLTDSFAIPGISFQYMQLGPDGRIYIVPPGRAPFWHIIQHPDAGSRAEIGFLSKGLALPVNCIRTLPRFPNYRLYDLAGSDCDTLGINAPTDISQLAKKDFIQLQASPNPANDRIRLSFEIPTTMDGQLEVFDSFGRKILIQAWPAGQAVEELILPGRGIYFAHWTNGKLWSPWLKIIAFD